MTHRGPFQPLPFCDSVTISYLNHSSQDTRHHNHKVNFDVDMRSVNEEFWFVPGIQKEPFKEI